MATSWNQPMCLVESTKDDGVKINEETLARLSEVREPVVVVGIAGTYRTGKSYLMNLLAGAPGFELGSTIQSKTKGIWAWVRPHPHRPNCCLLLLDTEGLADAEKGSAQHDTLIFALTVLLSSSLTYNSLNAIDQDAISKLHFVSEMAEHVKVKAGTQEEDGKQFAGVFPAFIWAVRDFHLDTEMDGQSMTSDQYLERILQLKTGTSPKIFNYNFPRECIRNYFPSRKCFAFPRPVEGKDNLKIVETLPPEALDREFVQISRQYMEYIFTTTPPKSVNSRVISGRMLGDLAKCYVTAMQNGAVPCIETAVETTAKLENARAIIDSVALYRAKMEERLRLPTEDMSTISTVHLCCEKEAIALFLQLAIFDKDHTFQEKMMLEVKNTYDAFCAQNEAESRRVCVDLLQRLHQEHIAGKQGGGHYAQPGGYTLYKTDMERIQNMYRDTLGKGTKAQETLAEFMTSKEAEGQSVLAADEKLDAEQKRAEALRQRAEAAAQEAKAAEEEKVKIEQQMTDMKTSYEENMKQLQDKMAEDKLEMMAENERVLNAKMSEQQQLLEEGFKEKSDLMRQEIEEIREEQKRDAEAASNGFLSFLGDIAKGVAGGIFGRFVDKILSSEGPPKPKKSK